MLKKVACKLVTIDRNCDKGYSFTIKEYLLKEAHMHRPRKELVLRVLRQAGKIMPGAIVTRRDLERLSPKDLRECLNENTDDQGGRLHQLARQARGCVSFYIG
ncbi:MAG: hypothetical protein HY460_01310 [Parcubacteria group bacterium]|nr:hypothetical protein [Parcubacteria group bacterium]